MTRCAWRAHGARNLYPADAALNLPEHLHSYGLARRAATEAVRGSFGTAQQAITRACGKVAGKRQVEQLAVAAASDIDAFYAASAPTPCTDDVLLVLSVDGKGVVMRPEALREETRKAAAAKGGATARWLEDAFRIAQVDLVGWLGGQYGLEVLDAYQMVTQASESPVANVCDPNYTFVTKLRKQWLPSTDPYGGMHRRLREMAAAYLAEHR